MYGPVSPNFCARRCCCPHCRCHPLGYSVPPAHHCTIWCRSTFGPRGPGLSNPTSFLRVALPMALTTDNNARDERSVLRPNSVTFLRDFTLHMTTNYAIIRKRCLDYIICLTQSCLCPYKGALKLAEIAKKTHELMGYDMVCVWRFTYYDR